MGVGVARHGRSRQSDAGWALRASLVKWPVPPSTFFHADGAEPQVIRGRKESVGTMNASMEQFAR
jgi:hypothetical protein